MTIEPVSLARIRRFFSEHALDSPSRAEEAIKELEDGDQRLFNALSRPRLDAVPQDSNAPFWRIVSGWHHYFRGSYSAALDAFEQAEGGSGDWESWRALGLGKVASDLGYWRTAAGWLRRSASLAFRENDMRRLAEASGALGEVLLRAGHPREALDLFAFDRALLPAGSSQHGRLRNYQAFALGRIKMCEATAEAALWESFYAAADRDSVSASFALAGLSMLSVRYQNWPLLDRVLRAKSPHSPDTDTATAPIAAALPSAFLFVAQAAQAARGEQPDEAEARRLLLRAIDSLTPEYPVEILWVKQRLQPASAAEWSEVLARRAPAPPPDGEPAALLTNWLDKVEIADGCAFDPLAKEGADCWDGLKLFML
jgi:hypothetical protein